MLYAAFYRGRHRVFDRAVQWWTRGPYSHCEIVLGSYVAGTHLCASASMMDSGVRVKAITLDPEKWVLVPLPGTAEPQVQRWLRSHTGQPYDLAGLLGFLWRPQQGRSQRWFCSEACAAMLGLPDAWRYCPNTLHSALTLLHAPHLRPAPPHDAGQSAR